MDKADFSLTSLSWRKCSGITLTTRGNWLVKWKEVWPGNVANAAKVWATTDAKVGEFSSYSILPCWAWLFVCRNLKSKSITISSLIKSAQWLRPVPSHYLHSRKQSPWWSVSLTWGMRKDFCFLFLQFFHIILRLDIIFPLIWTDFCIWPPTWVSWVPLLIYILYGMEYQMNWGLAIPHDVLICVEYTFLVELSFMGLGDGIK